MIITIYPPGENQGRIKRDLFSYISDELRTCQYESGELEGIHDKLDNLINFFSRLLEILLQNKELSLQDIREIIGTPDYIQKEDRE